jgi:hypothetical protein
MGDANQTGRELVHEYHSYHRRACNPPWWWRWLLVFASQVAENLPSLGFEITDLFYLVTAGAVEAGAQDPGLRMSGGLYHEPMTGCGSECLKHMSPTIR